MNKEDLYIHADETLKLVINGLKELNVFTPEIEIELTSYIKKYIKED